MIGWAWEGAADGSAGCGVSDDEDRAREAAEAWLKANPGSTAVLDTARLADGTTTLSSYWAKDGLARRSRRLRDGRIVWARIPALWPDAARALLGQDQRVSSYSIVMTDHPAWTPDGGRALVRAMPLGSGGHALARTDGSSVEWCCDEAAALAPEPGVFALPMSVAGEVPELAEALGSLGAVARFANPSLWDAIGAAIIRQVVRAAQAQAQYRTLCKAYGTPVACGTMAGWLFPSPGTVLSLSDAQFATVGLAFKRGALRAAAAAFAEHGMAWVPLPAAVLAAELTSVRRVGPWTAGAATADWANDFAAYPCGDLAVRTWAARAAPSAAWPGDEPGFRDRWRQVAGPHLANLTLLTLAWGGAHARAGT